MTKIFNLFIFLLLVVPIPHFGQEADKGELRILLDSIDKLNNRVDFERCSQLL